MKLTSLSRRAGPSVALAVTLLVSACGGSPATTPAATAAPVTSASSTPATGNTSALQASATSQATRSATLSEVKNKVETRLDTTDTTKWSNAQIGDKVAQGSQVRTGEAASARIDLTEGTVIRVGSNTVFTVEELKPSPQDPLTRLQLLGGQVWIALNGGSMDVQTPVGVASVRGSYLYVSIITSTTSSDITITLQCMEGSCGLATAGQGDINFSNGETALVILSGNLPPNITTGIMTDEDIKNFLLNSPEATVVVPTAQAAVETNAAAATATKEASATPTLAPSATPTLAAAVTATVMPTATKKRSTAVPQPTFTPIPTEAHTATPVPSATQTSGGSPQPTKPAPTDTPVPPPTAPPTNTPVPPPSPTSFVP